MDQLGELLYIKTPANRTCLVVYRNVVVYEQVEDGVLLRKEMILKSKMRPQMEMGIRGIIL